MKKGRAGLLTVLLSVSFPEHQFFDPEGYCGCRTVSASYLFQSRDRHGD